MKTIGIITTSRADFGIYLPLIRRIIQEDKLKLIIYAGGMHVSEKFGLTLNEVRKINAELHFTPDFVSNLAEKNSYAVAMAKTTASMANLIEKSSKIPEVIFVLGDRFEMFAAAAAVVPLRIKLAHLHGGEDSLGALDQKYRNAITSLSDVHFASTADHASRVVNITGSKDNVFNVGALGIEAIKETTLLGREEFYRKYNLKIGEDFVLSTIHPETMNDDNKDKINRFIAAVEAIPFSFICTLPNADSQGDIIRNALVAFEKRVGKSKFQCVENMGFKGYYSAMNYCKMLIGNSSSGIIEAATFHKKVINLGSRQSGRTAGKNVYHVPFDEDKIVEMSHRLMSMREERYENPYGDGSASEKILKALNLLS